MKIPVELTDVDFEALKTLSRTEYRDVRGQAAILIREELQKKGLLNNHQINNLPRSKEKTKLSLA